VSIHRVEDGVFKIRWREGGRNRSLRVHGSHELAKKVLRKRLSARDENRHLDIKREVNFRMSALIDRYWEQYASKKNLRTARKLFWWESGSSLETCLSERLAAPAFNAGTKASLSRRGCQRARPFGT
jgi:hypothetical protein